MAKINTNMASEFWFYSQLHRLGYQSYITLGNTKAIDIVVILNDENNTRLTFDVKGKQSLSSGSFQYLPKIKIAKHYFAFVGLGIKKIKGSKKVSIENDVECYIIESINLDMIANDWIAKNGKAKGYGLEPKFLRHIKSNGKEKITERAIQFVTGKNYLTKKDIQKYNKIILTIDEFENKFYSKK